MEITPGPSPGGYRGYGAGFDPQTNDVPVRIRAALSFVVGGTGAAGGRGNSDISMTRVHYYISTVIFMKC